MHFLLFQLVIRDPALSYKYEMRAVCANIWVFRRAAQQLSCIFRSCSSFIPYIIMICCWIHLILWFNASDRTTHLVMVNSSCIYLVSHSKPYISIWPSSMPGIVCQETNNSMLQKKWPSSRKSKVYVIVLSLVLATRYIWYIFFYHWYL